MLVSCVGTGWYAAWLVISLAGLSSFTALRRQSCFLNQYSLGLFRLLCEEAGSHPTSPPQPAGRLYRTTEPNRGAGECFETLSSDLVRDASGNKGDCVGRIRAWQ